MTREEAIETIRRCCPKVGDSQCYFESALRELIPELAESEDERIRKEIISALKFANDGGVYDKHIAYLEKQKDANKAIEAVDRIDKYIDVHLANAHDMKDSNPDKKYYRGWDDALGKISGILQDVYSGANQKEEEGYEAIPIESTLEFKVGKHAGFLEGLEVGRKQKGPKPSIFPPGLGEVHFNPISCEQKEQKPKLDEAGKLEFCKKCSRSIFQYQRGYDQGLIDGQIKTEKEQKPAEWSKNDTVFLNEITDFFENKTVKLQHDLDMYAHWLKSLPERFNLQPKQEWSEEDERMLSRCIKSIETSKQFADSSTFTIAKDKEIDWLKSLRPQPHWKPSEEQMDALRVTLEYMPDTFKPRCTLMTLQNDLEKLT